MTKLRCAIIGLGHFAKHYVRLLSIMPDVELAAIATRTAGAFGQYKDVIPTGVITTTDVQAIMDDSAIDCVFIITPPSTHMQLIEQAITAGKHVFVEKPMVMNVSEADHIAALLAKNPVTFMVGYQYVYNDFVRVLKQILPELGMLHYVVGAHWSPGPLRTDVGSFQDAGTHDVAIIEYLFNPGSVVKAGGSSFSVSGNREDFTSAGVEFESGIRVQIITARYWPKKIRRFTVVGERGIVQINDQLENNKLQLWRHTYPNVPATQASSVFINLPEPEIPAVDAHEPLQNEIEHFFECVRNNTQPITDIAFGRRVTENCETILEKIEKI